jgi:hypothetical protein
MTYERFLKIGLTLQKQDRVISKFYKNKVDLMDLVEPYSVVVGELIKEVYGEGGYEWWSWFCYEAEYGQKDFSKYPTFTFNGDKLVKVKEAGETRWGANDEKGNPICYSWESLYEYLEKNHKQTKQND